MLRYNPRDLPFHSHFLDLIWHGRTAELLDDVQQSEPLWPTRKTWTEGGCLILATGILDWMRSSPFVCGKAARLPQLSSEWTCVRAQMRLPSASERPMKLALWESWDEKPYHVVVALGDLFLDGDGLGDCDTLLTNWEDYFRGGAYLAPLSEQDARDYGFPQAGRVSRRITDDLKHTFGPFHPDLLRPLPVFC